MKTTKSIRIKPFGKTRNNVLPRSANRSKYQPTVASRGLVYSSQRNVEGFRSKDAVKFKQV